MTNPNHVVKRIQEQGQDKLCPFCLRGLHDRCIARIDETLCCCGGEPSRQLSTVDRDNSGRIQNIPREPIETRKIIVLKKRRKQKSVGVQVNYNDEYLNQST